MPTIIAFHPTGFEVRFDVDLGGIADMVRRLEQRHYRQISRNDSVRSIRFLHHD